MIVVGGEALIDLVPADPDRPLGSLLPLPGGGPYNVAIALGRLGAPVAFLSRLSTDGFGDGLLDRLRMAGVRTDLVQRGPEPTALAVAGIGSDGSARYSFHVDGTADRLVTAELPAGTEVLSLGTLGMLLEPGASEYERLLWSASAAGALCVLDPNVRPALVADPAAYRARVRSWLPHVGLLKLSVEDARWLLDLPDDAPADAVLAGLAPWRERGPAAVVLTLGGAGLLAVTDHGDVAVPARRVRVVDTIGAGDTVHGALIGWLHGAGVRSRTALAALDRDGWRAALAYAAEAASVTVSRAGAEPPFCTELSESRPRL